MKVLLYPFEQLGDILPMNNAPLKSKFTTDFTRYADGLRGGLGISDRPISGMTAIFFHNSRSISDETTETQPLAGLQGEGGFGSLERREDDRAACCAL